MKEEGRAQNDKKKFREQNASSEKGFAWLIVRYP